jgi:hypothetical protein
LPARTWRGIKARGHFPTEQAALKCLYLVTLSPDPTACREDLAIYRETGDQYREGIAFKKSSEGPGRTAGRRPPGAPGAAGSSAGLSAVSGLVA